MKKKTIQSVSMCLLLALSLFFLPACSWFQKDYVQTEKGSTIQGGNNNTPNSRYSSFLTSISQTKNYTGSYKLNYDVRCDQTDYEYLELTSIVQNENTITKSISGSNSLDAENHAYYQHVSNGFLGITETIYKNIKTSDEASAEDLFVEKHTINNETLKTQEGRTIFYYLGNGTMLSSLPEFDTINAINNSKLVGSRNYSPLYNIYNYIVSQGISQSDAQIAFLKNLDTHYLNGKDLKVEISMPESSTDTIVQFAINATYESEGTYKYNKYAITTKYYCANGKLNKITQTYILGQSASENKKRFDKSHYDRETKIDFELNVDYKTSWDTTQESYTRTFSPTFLTSKIASIRANKDALETTKNNIFIMIGENTIKAFENLSEEDVMQSATIYEESKTQNAKYLDVSDPTNKKFVNATINIELFYDKALTQPVLAGTPIKTEGHNIYLYGRYIVPSGKCVVIVREFTQPYKTIKNYYQKTNKLNLDYIQNSLPIIFDTTTFNYSYLETGYNQAGYAITTYIDGAKNTTNQPLSFRQNRIFYLDFYLVEA